MSIHDHITELRELLIAIAEAVDTLPVSADASPRVHLGILALLDGIELAEWC